MRALLIQNFKNIEEMEIKYFFNIYFKETNEVNLKNSFNSKSRVANSIIV